MGEPYREPAEIAADIPKAPRKWRSPVWLPALMGVVTFAGCVVGAGLAHDLCRPGHEGVAWSSGVILVLLACVFGIGGVAWSVELDDRRTKEEKKGDG